MPKYKLKQNKFPINKDSEFEVFGRIVKKYKIPLDLIDDLNTKYEEVIHNLDDSGLRLAGRLKTELDFTNVLQATKMFPWISECMLDFVSEHLLHSAQYYDKHYILPNFNLDILKCWVNDMVAGEYNPPHTHHDLKGFSCILFLKVPPFVNDIQKNKSHKFKDGQVGFITTDGIGTVWKQPKVGDFYLFDAAHQHCVMPFKTKKKDEIRRSLSFNFIMYSKDKK